MRIGKLILSTLCLAVICAGSAQASLIITGVIDGPRTGGLPKAIELYACEDIPDLSIYNVETPNNGGAAVGSEFALSGSASAGDYIWIASEDPGFTAYFGFSPTFVNGVANINGDDNVILYKSTVTHDQFGVNGQDGSGFPWEYTDSYAYRLDLTGPDATFNIANWNIPGIDLLDPQGSSGVNGSANITVPFGTYVCVPEPTSIALMLGCLGVMAIRRK